MLKYTPFHLCLFPICDGQLGGFLLCLPLSPLVLEVGRVSAAFSCLPMSCLRANKNCVSCSSPFVWQASQGPQFICAAGWAGSCLPCCRSSSDGSLPLCHSLPPLVSLPMCGNTVHTCCEAGQGRTGFMCTARPVKVGRVLVKCPAQMFMSTAA